MNSLKIFVAFILATSFVQSLAAQNWYNQALQRIEQHRKADLTVRVVDWQGLPVEGASVEVEMQRHAFRWGTAVPAWRINNGSATSAIYRARLLENFNHVVFENDLKWPAWIGLWGNSFNWPNTQLAMNWCDANNLGIRGHYLAWATWSGPDAWGDSEDTSTLQTRLFNHMTEKAATVGNRVVEWDVINHPVGWTGTTYENFFGNQFYGDIIDHARSVAPVGMEMWINEDNILAGGFLSNQYKTIIQNLINQGSSPDGIGFQCHFVEEWGRIVSGEHVYDKCVEFANVIPRLQATEFDIDVGDNESLQATLMNDYLVAMFSHPNMEGITLWGFWEDQHWRPNAALYRSDWSEKPALTAYRNLVYGDWWTEASGSSNVDGEFEVRGVLGNYDIVVIHDGRAYSVSYDLEAGSDTIDIVVGGVLLAPYSMTPGPDTRIARGDLNSLTASENDKVTLNTNAGREVSLEINTISPTDNPTELEFTLEGSTRSTIADVSQIIEMYNFAIDEWEQVDVRAAKVLGASLTDLVTELTITGDLSRFVEPGTRRMRANIRFLRSGLTRRLTGYIDQAHWRVYQ